MKKSVIFVLCVACFTVGALITGFAFKYSHDCLLEKVLEQQEKTKQETSGDSLNVMLTSIPSVGDDICKIKIRKKAQPEPKPTEQPKPEDPHQDKKFSKKFSSSRDIEDIRKDDFGIGYSKKIKVFEHKGGQAIDPERLEATVRAVLQRMPNIKTTDDLVKLCIETMQTETGCGAEKVSTGITKWNNYGIAQFRVDTAEETLAWLKKVRRDVYDQVMDLTDRKHDLKYELSYNVPFSIALMVQYYWRRVPDLYNHIDTQVKRAELWKSEYNSSIGKGTVACYLKRNGGK